MGLSHFCMPHEQSHGTPFGSDYLFKDRMFLKAKYRHAYCPLFKIWFPELWGSSLAMDLTVCMSVHCPSLHCLWELGIAGNRHKKMSMLLLQLLQ